MAETKVYKSSDWESAGKGLSARCSRASANVTVAAGWHTEFSYELEKGNYSLTGQFTFNTTEATTVCLLISIGSDTGMGSLARGTVYAPANENKAGVNIAAHLNENDFGNDSKRTFTLLLWNNKAITRTDKAFTVAKLD